MSDDLELAPPAETITMPMIQTWGFEKMKRYMKGPLRETIIKVIAEAEQAKLDKANAPSQELAPELPVQTQEEIDAAQQAADAESVRVATEQAEAERLAALPPKPDKYVIDYQVRDEDGTPLGRPTHLEAATQEELTQKMIEAHTQAVRWGHRLKRQKVSQQTERQTVSAPAPTDEELLTDIKDLKSDDPQVALAAHKKLNEVEQNKKNAAYAEQARKNKVTADFLALHKDDYNNNDANANAFKEYFEKHQLDWTSGNLEIALEALESKLAPVVREPVAQPTAVNPTSVVQPQVTPAAVQPTVVTPVVPVAPNPAPAVPRPGVNGGIVPGQHSAPRPTATSSSSLTMADIHSWDGPTFRKNKNDKVLGPQIAKVLAEYNAAQAAKPRR